MSRYFIVFYAHSRGFGNSNIEVPNGTYINHEATKRQIEEKSGVKEVIVISVLELTQKDCEMFYYKQPI